MNAIKATWKNGQILPREPVDWPEGSELVVEPMTATAEKIGLDEAEWRDDAESLAGVARVRDHVDVTSLPARYAGALERD